jgi:hypothetical protein
MSAHQATGSCDRLVRGRRLLGPEGGNRGVVAQGSVLLPCYGDCKPVLYWRLVRVAVCTLVCTASRSVFGKSSRVSVVLGAWVSIDLSSWSSVGQSPAVTVWYRQFTGVGKFCLMRVMAGIGAVPEQRG